MYFRRLSLDYISKWYIFIRTIEDRSVLPELVSCWSLNICFALPLSFMWLASLKKTKKNPKCHAALSKEKNIPILLSSPCLH